MRMTPINTVLLYPNYLNSTSSSLPNHITSESENYIKLGGNFIEYLQNEQISR